jgi:hypothetical protein
MQARFRAWRWRSRLFAFSICRLVFFHAMNACQQGDHCRNDHLPLPWRFDGSLRCSVVNYRAEDSEPHAQHQDQQQNCREQRIALGLLDIHWTRSAMFAVSY